MNNPGEIQAWRFFFEEFGCNHDNLDKGLRSSTLPFKTVMPAKRCRHIR